MPGSIQIVGTLGADAELRNVGEGQVANLRVACSCGYGQRKTTSWWSVEVWGKPAEWAAELRKGTHVTVFGELTAREHKGAIYNGIRASMVQEHKPTGGKTDADPF